MTHAVSNEVASSGKARGIKMPRDETNAKGEVKTVYNPLLVDRWRVKVRELPHLATLARRVLSIPAVYAGAV